MKEEKKQRGYFGIGIEHGKTPMNLGTLWRSAYQMGAAFIFTIGARHNKQSSDTYKAYRHIPLFQFLDWEAFASSPIYDCLIIGVEFNDTSIPIKEFKHPQRTIYLLGAEDHGLSKKAQDKCVELVELPAIRMPSYNVAVAGSLVMFDRLQKTNTK